MTLRMADGPVENLPAGLDAYAGYSDDSGIGVTWPEVQKLPAKYHLSISVHGQAPAMCGDVENGALSSWVGYDYGYCAVSNANAMIAQFGRPKKLWLAHYDPSIGSHICSPACWPGLVTTADGTQWTDHNNVWDESLLSDDFFGAPAPTPPPAPSLYSPVPPPLALLLGGSTMAALDKMDMLIGTVDWAYMEYLGRPADPGGEQTYVTLLNTQGITAVIKSLTSSAEGQAYQAAKRKSLGL